jgi:exosortase A
LAKLAPQRWWPGLLLAGAGLIGWLGGTALGINTASQLGAVVMLQAAVAVLLGPRVVAGLLFPLAYMFFLVPFGDEIVPALQAITARMAVALTHASGVPAAIDGVFIDTPVGLFEVAEACSGVKFLVAMIALGTLVAHLCFASWKRRAAFMAVAVVVPVLANGVRAWGTIYIAQSQGIAFAAGFDHIVYGWIFFALVMALVLGVSWRFFDRAADDPLIDAAAIEASPLLARLAPPRPVP